MASLREMSADELEAHDLALNAEKEAAYEAVEAVRVKQRELKKEQNRRAALDRFGQLNEDEKRTLLEALTTGTSEGDE